MMRALIFFGLLGAAGRAETVLMITAHAEDYLLCAAGTVAGMAQRGADVYVVRVTNDEKTGGMSPEENALRGRAESEEAGRILGVKKLVHLGYRSGELGAVSPTELRDRVIFLIRHYKPAALFIPDPYTHQDAELDHYYAGSAAEEARLAAGLKNFQPPHEGIGLKPHQTAELYYYSLPFEGPVHAETAPPFTPQPRFVDIGAMLERKLQAMRALRTYNRALALDVASRLARTGRRLPLLDSFDEQAANRLMEIRVRELARQAGAAAGIAAAEGFLVSRR